MKYMGEDALKLAEMLSEVYDICNRLADELPNPQYDLKHNLMTSMVNLTYDITGILVAYHVVYLNEHIDDVVLQAEIIANNAINQTNRKDA